MFYSIIPKNSPLITLICFVAIWAIMRGIPTEFSTQEESVNLEKTSYQSLPVGVTRAGTPIPGYVPADDPGLMGTPRRLVLVAGLMGDRESARIAAELVQEFSANQTAGWRQRWTLTVVPLVNPDQTPPADRLLKAFPPPAESYLSETVPEAQSLWRWLAISGADVVLELRASKDLPPGWYGPGAKPLEDGELAEALNTENVATLGKIPAWRLNVANEKISWEKLLAELETLNPAGRSPVRRVLQSRLERSPLVVAEQLVRHYGKTFQPVEYLQGTALLAKWRLGQLTNNPAMQQEVEALTNEWLGKTVLTEKSNGSVFAGHLVFAALAQNGQHAGYVDLVRQVADLGFDENGQPRAAMPMHQEMSDAIFMSTPIMVEAGRLTGEAKYYEMAGRHLRFMLDLNLRQDGLHRHSPLDETAWGRGNGFPALGLTLCLEQIPEDRPERSVMLAALQKHVAALAEHQDSSGMWHQVIDHPESYRELTATCMITYAMLRGMREGWLDRRYEPHVEKAWNALKLRIGEDGTLFDVCTGTGKQKSLRAYYDRPAILGRDARGGAMSLLVATEYAAWNADRQSRPAAR